MGVLPAPEDMPFSIVSTPLLACEDSIVAQFMLLMAGVSGTIESVSRTAREESLRMDVTWKGSRFE